MKEGGKKEKKRPTGAVTSSPLHHTSDGNGRSRLKRYRPCAGVLWTNKSQVKGGVPVFHRAVVLPLETMLFSEFERDCSFITGSAKGTKELQLSLRHLFQLFGKLRKPLMTTMTLAFFFLISNLVPPHFLVCSVLLSGA